MYLLFISYKMHLSCAAVKRFIVVTVIISPYQERSVSSTNNNAEYE